MKLKFVVHPKSPTSEASSLKLCLDIACELAKAFSAVLGKLGFPVSSETKPDFDRAAMTATCEIEIQESRDLFETLSTALSRMQEATNLLNAVENLQQGVLLDRITTNSDARFPIPVRYDQKSHELVVYDAQLDQIRTSHPAAAETVKQNESVIRILTKGAAQGLGITLVADHLENALPVPSATIFSHGVGPGETSKTPAVINGLFPVGKEAEAKLFDVRENRIVRVSLCDEALEKIARKRFPISCHLSYFELESVMPLVTKPREKIVVVDIWNVAEQEPLQLE